jgi:hypothetical protein
MNTKDAILVVAGVAVGYLLAGYLKKSKDNSVTGTTTSIGAVASAPSQATIDACNKEADDYMAMSKFTSGADLGKIRKEKFDACIASKQV